MLGRLRGRCLVVGRGRREGDVAVDAGVKGDDRDVLRLRLIHQRRARLRIQRRKADRRGLLLDRVGEHRDLLLDVLLGRRALEGDAGTLGLGLLLGALLDRLPELVLEALGDDRDVRLLAASTTAAAGAGRGAARLVVRATGRDREGQRCGDDRRSSEPLRTDH